MRRIPITGWLLAACLLPGQSAGAESSPPSLDSVLERVKVTPPAEVAYSELRHSSLFDEPLEMRGRLEYLPGSILRKVVESPFREILEFDGEHIAVKREDEPPRLVTKGSRQVRNVLGGIRAVLAGDGQHLEKDFHVMLEGVDSDWKLHLTPRSKQLARHLESITVAGDASRLMSMRFDMGGGEWQEMTLLHPPEP